MVRNHRRKSEGGKFLARCLKSKGHDQMERLSLTRLVSARVVRPRLLHQLGIKVSGPRTLSLLVSFLHPVLYPLSPAHGLQGRGLGGDGGAVWTAIRMRYGRARVEGVGSPGGPWLLR